MSHNGTAGVLGAATAVGVVVRRSMIILRLPRTTLFPYTTLFRSALAPAISIGQKSTSPNPRSTVGTITEIYDYLRLLFARIGEPRCPIHHLPLAAQTVSQMVDSIMALPEEHRYMLLAPVVTERKGEFVKLFEQLSASGYTRVRVDGDIDRKSVV